MPLPLEQVAEQRDELRERYGRRRPPCRDDRRAEPSPRGVDPGLLLEREDVSGEDRERSPDMLGRRFDPAVAERELRKLHVGPGSRFGRSSRGVERELHRRSGARPVADQLARVRDAGVGGEARPHGRHPVERREGLAIAAELDQRVADDAVGTLRRTARGVELRDRGRARDGSRGG